MTSDEATRAASGSVSGPALVFIFGPAAVGKMTVGQALKELTGYRLLYNHMVADLVTEFFQSLKICRRSSEHGERSLPILNHDR